MTNIYTGSGGWGWLGMVGRKAPLCHVVYEEKLNRVGKKCLQACHFLDGEKQKEGMDKQKEIGSETDRDRQDKMEERQMYH